MTRLSVTGSPRYGRHHESTRPSRTIFIVLVANVAIFTFAFFNEVPLIWCLIMALWSFGFAFCWIRLHERIFALLFLLSFFLFLLSRPVLALLFDFYQEEFDPLELQLTGNALLIALLCFLVPFICLEVRLSKRSGGTQVSAPPNLGARREPVRKASICLFWIAVPGAIYSFWTQIEFIGSNSYIDVYTEAFARYSASPINTIANYMADIALVALIVFLATKPSLNKVYLPCLTWLALTGSLLMAGQRRDFLLALALFVGYTVIRRKERHGVRTKRSRYIILALGLAPAAAAVLDFVGRSRGLGSSTSTFPDSAFLNFIYGQGVSVNTLISTIRYETLLPDQFYLAEFLRTGLLARALNIDVLQGNSVERAFEGGSLSHSLSFIVLGDRYIGGVSTGSSYIAEGYATWGHLGIAAVSFAYAMILHQIGKFGSGPLSTDVVRLLIVPSVIWAPRGSSTGLLSFLVAPSTIAACCLILFASLTFQTGLRDNREASLVLHSGVR